MSTIVARTTSEANIHLDKWENSYC
ncbi:hypothetical protein CGLO_13918 [Colletotrichum gloeosporioides Cg-14]|uniref:Uncharacterized protein n=1 Tax=Colletotrichum gloeosporioides (strain Cg-14) TaxID=1237896 RepID=T0JVF7_COLGC|nr:hypothetical protein CGLO_13918 [Colletotrichum gloeosporioides Cg-14]